VIAEDLEDELTNEKDFLQPLYEHEARMYSLEQLQ
jgi:hypothetical protein